MTTLKSRLEELMSDYGLTTQQQLADFAGVSKGLVGQWFNGSTGLGKKPLLAFQKKTNYSTQWLTDGTGSKYIDELEAAPSRHAGFAARLAQSIATAGMDLAVLAKKSFVPQERIEVYLTGTKLPYVEDAENLAAALGVGVEWLRFGEDIRTPPTGSGVAATHDSVVLPGHFRIMRYDISLSAGEGNAIWVEREDDDDPLLFRYGWLKVKGLRQQDLRAMYVRGDSMDPVLKHWDTVVIDVSDTGIDDGEIYALFFKDKLYIKQLRNTENGVDLISFNPDYDVMHVTEENADRFQVLGRMVWRGG